MHNGSYQHSVRIREAKERKQFALPVLMYGLIPSDSFHAICKCINKGYKAIAIYPTHNTQGQGIENLESTIDSCISRNYPRIRMNATTTKNFTKSRTSSNASCIKASCSNHWVMKNEIFVWVLFTWGTLLMWHSQEIYYCSSIMNARNLFLHAFSISSTRF